MRIIIFLSMIMAPFVKDKLPEFASERISRTASIKLMAPIERVFPLFGPVREKEWAEGWDPQIISPVSGDIEQHMVFLTKGKHASEPFYRWAITKYQPEDYVIEYTVSTANRIWFVSIQCRAVGAETGATITYTYIGLNEIGNDLNKVALAAMYSHDLHDWETAINYFLKNGKLLKQHEERNEK